MKRIAGLISAAGLVFTVACGQTDAGITTSVKTKLAADDMVKAYEVDVDTNNKVVTLSGEVSSPMARDRALQLARDTDGVSDVIDQLRIDDTAATSGRLDIDDDIDVDVNVDPSLRRDAEDAASATGAAARRGAEATKDAAERAGDAAERAADKSVDAAKKAGRATADAGKKIGNAVKDAVTDDDPDSDNDGK